MPATCPSTIESVLRQTLADIEVIYLDDASSDNGAEVMARYRSDPRLRVFSNEVNSGNTFLQWKRGLEHCRGQYVWIAEADDYAHPQFLAELVGRLDRHPEIGVAYCQSWIVDEESRVLHPISNTPKVWTRSVGSRITCRTATTSAAAR